MKKEQALLLTKAELIPAAGPLAVYDDARQLLVVEATGEPLVMTSAGVTHSKTSAAPGDDDPDPGQERCY